jgi:site-specific recombinase XerD
MRGNSRPEQASRGLARPPFWSFPRHDGEHPIHSTTLKAACLWACAAVGLSNRVIVHTLRHSFAPSAAFQVLRTRSAHLLESGTDIRVNQVLLGHHHGALCTGCDTS